MNKKGAIALLIIFIISRVFFINSQDVFFDSGEYLNAFSNPNFFQALLSVHFPIHEGYMLLFWPIFQLATFLEVHAGNSVIFAQIILATITIYCFYNFLVFLSDKRTALLGTILASLTPLFWITNVTIMMENAYIAFFFLSLFFLVKYSTKQRSFFAHLSSLFFTLSFITQPVIVLWLPFLLTTIWVKKKQILLKFSIYYAIYMIILNLLNLLFIGTSMNISVPQAFHEMFLNKKNEFPFLSWNIKSLLVVARNFFIPLMKNNTSLIVILAFTSLTLIYLKNKKLFLLCFLWITPALYTNQWWDSLFPGRHSLIAGFGLAFLVAYLSRKKILYFAIILIYLFSVSLPTLNLLNKEVPYIKLAEFTRTLPKASLLVESHFSRPQVEKRYQGKLISVNGGLGSSTIIQEINTYLKNEKPVFISSHALSDPYGLYSGPYLHSLSLSYRNPPELASYLKGYSVSEVKIISSDDNLIIYKITSNENATYPKINYLYNSYRRLDYYDPLWKLYKFIVN